MKNYHLEAQVSQSIRTTLMAGCTSCGAVLGWQAIQRVPNLLRNDVDLGVGTHKRFLHALP
jgi:hypothetical protein